MRQKNSEKLLKIMEKNTKECELYRSIVEKMGNVIVDWDLIKDTLYSSDSYKNYIISQYYPKDIFDNNGKPETVFPDDIKRSAEFFSEIKVGKTFVKTTLRLKMSDESYCWTSVNAHIVYNEMGETIRIICILHNINNEKSIEIKNQLNIKQMNTIMDKLDIHYWEFDIVRNLAIYSKRTQEAFNFPPVMYNYPESLLETSVIADKYKDEYRRIHKELKNGIEKIHMNFPILSSKGTVVWKDICYHTIFENGLPSKAIGTAVNITTFSTPQQLQNQEVVTLEKMTSQEALASFFLKLQKNSKTNMVYINKELKTNIIKKNDEQQKNYAYLSKLSTFTNRTSTEKNIFLYSISHDMKTLVNDIVNVFSVTNETLDQNHAIINALNNVNFKAKLLSNLINDIFDINLMESGKYVFNREPISITQLLHNIETSFMETFNKNGQSFTIRKINIVHNCLLGDLKQTFRIFNNLLLNSSKYTSFGGKISLTVKELPSPVRKIAYFCFTVKDNGIGIIKDDLPLVFKPYYKTNKSYNNNNGKGIGLAVVYSIVRAMGGSVNIVSKKNNGTKVCVYLPFMIDSN